MIEKRPVFVLTAQISAHLYFAMNVAKQISLTAKNARATTIRAGPRAAGFQAITNFIEELAKNTIASADHINEIAIKISRMASDQALNKKALDHLEWVNNNAANAAYIQSISGAKTTLSAIHEDYLMAFKAELASLALQLEESSKQVRSANIIASTSKIEASQCIDFQGQLLAITDDIEQAAHDIRYQLRSAERLLEETRAA